MSGNVKCNTAVHFNLHGCEWERSGQIKTCMDAVGGVFHLSLFHAPSLSLSCSISLSFVLHLSLSFSNRFLAAGAQDFSKWKVGDGITVHEMCAYIHTYLHM